MWKHKIIVDAGRNIKFYFQSCFFFYQKVKNKSTYKTRVILKVLVINGSLISQIFLLMIRVIQIYNTLINSGIISH